MKQRFFFLSIILLISASVYSQLGITAGVNMANTKHLFNNPTIASTFNSENLTGYRAGLTYQLNTRSGFGLETGILFGQNGSMFSFDKRDRDIAYSIKHIYEELNYIEVPLGARYALNFGRAFGVFGNVGIYGDYALRGKTVMEGASEVISDKQDLGNFTQRLDYGYSFGFGIQFIKKIQLEAKWHQGLHKKDTDKGILDMIKNQQGQPGLNLEATNTAKALSLSLTYLF